MQEETVVEGETCIVECERLALVRGSGENNLSNAHVFMLGTCPRPLCVSLRMTEGGKKQVASHPRPGKKAHL